MKYLVLIPDGMADEPISALNGKTPMQAASKPTMDFLASLSTVGTVISNLNRCRSGRQRIFILSFRLGYIFLQKKSASF